MSNTDIDSQIELNINKYISELSKLIESKTIAIDDNKPEFNEATEYLKNLLTSSGINDIKIINEFGNQIIFAQNNIDKNLKTVLLYAHYDVQPAEPLNLWNSDPFKLTIKDNYLFGRGVADDKTLLYSIIKALELIKNNKLNLNYNIKIVFEPSEESSSIELNKLFKDENNLQKYKDLFKCDVLLACDSDMISEEKPSISTSVRGILATEVTIFGPNRDLHSGSYGGVVGNPITEMCRLLDNIHDLDNKIKIHGFYDNVNNFNEDELIDIDLEDLKKDIEVDDVIYEKGYTLKQCCTTRPTFEINGIYGGYNGKGSKTIIPNYCVAKISCRLVDNQVPYEIFNKIQEYFKNNIRKAFKFKIDRNDEGSMAVNSNTNSNEFRKIVNILSDVYNKKIVFDKVGGSIPIISKFKEVLGCDVIFVGFAYNNCNCHGPNENYSLQSLKNGIKTLVNYLTTN